MMSIFISVKKPLQVARVLVEAAADAIKEH